MAPRALFTILRRSTASLSTVPRRSIITITRPLLGPLKENTTSDPPSPAEIERHKKDSLDKQRSGHAEWKAELASVSEECVKADREEVAGEDEGGFTATSGGSKSGPDAMKRLQERTKGVAEATRKHMEEVKI
ncbi:hypothetical protein VTJ49DRAFT_346 [Mycothermus thermophilus]|uniref:Uncharacterized protein n=1 Tax=Humicola insolens TaxID=85995 RepID=A0ABR3VF85_HUMIN